MNDKRPQATMIDLSHRRSVVWPVPDLKAALVWLSSALPEIFLPLRVSKAMAVHVRETMY